MATITTDPQISVVPFVILVDSREQLPYTFDSIPPTGRDRGKRLIVRTETRGLGCGDYSVDGFADRVAVERKSLEDLFSTLGQGRERFEREFEKLNQLDWAAVVIEADIREIWRPQEFRPGWQSRLNPRSVEGTIVSWSIRFPRVHWWPMGSRRAAEIRTFEVLERFWRENQK